MHNGNLNPKGTVICLLVVVSLLFFSASSFSLSQSRLLSTHAFYVTTQDDHSKYCQYLPSDDAVLAHGKEVISHPVSTLSMDRYEILLPNVRQPLTHYKNIRFRNGDEIIINACGCVQTGGTGKTWKRYLFPLGPNSEKYYHGVITTSGGISISPPPGASKTQWPSLSPTITQPLKVFRIDEFIAAQGNGFRYEAIGEGYLILGYEDDDYSDNGYDRHDPGNPEQCQNTGGAGVSITIKHKTHLTERPR